MKKILLLAIVAISLNAGCLDAMNEITESQKTVVKALQNKSKAVAKIRATTTLNMISTWLETCKDVAPQNAVNAVIQQGMLDVEVINAR